MEQQSIYDEDPDPVSMRPRTASKATPPPKEEVFPVSSSTQRVWSAPLISREKLTETLNALEKEHYEVFNVITVSASTVQIVCFQEVDVDDERH